MSVDVVEEIRRFIREPDGDGFDDLALRVFAFQYERNAPYRTFCDRRGRNPSNVGGWREIPAVPVAAFEAVDLAVPGLGEGLEFLTSGTTRGRERRGRHRVPDPSIYREASLRHFEAWCLSDGARPRFLVLAPSAAEEPQSSLCRMIAWLTEAFGSEAAEHFVDKGELREDRLAARLSELASSRAPLLLFGLTHAFVRFHDVCRARDVRFRLPYGSRIVDTGGTKNRSRVLSRPGLLRAFWELFGVPGYWVAGEYGMTEMCSQFYESPIRDHVEGRKRDRRWVAPAWVRTVVVSPETLEPVADGERGLLRHLDLANVGSVAAIQTEDVGVWRGHGFELVGRARGAELRGCAQLVEDVRS